MVEFDEIEQYLDGEVTDDRSEIGVSATCSGIQAALRSPAGERWQYSTGWSTLEGEPEPVDDETPVDLASLTKPIATATLLYQAIDEEKAAWTTPVAKLIDWWPAGKIRAANLRDLCMHISGLPDWLPLYEDLPLDPANEEQRESNLRAIESRLSELRVNKTPGESETYSDLGYIALMRCLERIFDDAFDVLVSRRVLEPVGMTNTSFVATHREQPPLRRAMATEAMADRGGVVRGRVHDRNCAVMGGVSGHAGLFGTASDVLTFAEHLLAVDGGETEGIVSEEVLNRAWAEPNRAENRRHRGGWDTPSGEESQAGSGFAARDSVGHLGFTGTSVWIDRDEGWIAVLLTNRVYPSRENDRIEDLRVEFHEMALGQR